MFKVVKSNRYKHGSTELIADRWFVIPESPVSNVELNRVAKAVFGPMYAGVCHVYFNGQWLQAFRMGRNSSQQEAEKAAELCDNVYFE